MTLKLALTLLILFLLLFTAVFAQPVQPGQVTFIPPLGTHGKTTDSLRFYASINVLCGITGGISGVELGSVCNITKGNVSGVQVAGISNTISGDAHAIQGAGILNSSESLTGAQLAGILNIAHKKSIGVQCAGIYNSVPDIVGAQIGGICNSSDTIRGFQVAGLLNKTAHLEGVQIGGIYNQTDRLKGCQIGLINIADTLESGVSIGLIPIIKKNGYNSLELSYNETFDYNLGIKLGARPLYIAYFVRYKEFEGQDIYGIGAGIGSNIKLWKKVSLTLDASCTQVNIDEWWTDELNLINRFETNVNYQISKHLAVFGGMSFNTAVSKLKDEEGHVMNNPLVPESNYYEDITRHKITTLYPGFNIGIQILN